MNKLVCILLLVVFLTACTAGAGQPASGEISIPSQDIDQKIVLDPSISVPETGQLALSDNTYDIEPVSVSVQTTDPAMAPPSSPPELAAPQAGEPLTALQLQLQQAIQERKATGLPVPSSVTFKHQASSQEALMQISGAAAAPVPGKVVSETVLKFDGPEQAGYMEWPPMVAKEDLPPELQATATEEEYTEAYRAFMEKKVPGIWEKYKFGHEPRTYTFVETFETTIPAGESLSPAQIATSSDLLLMGFTYTGPRVRYILEQSLKIPVIFIGSIEVYYVKAGLEIDWDLGLRLPGMATINGPDQLSRGNMTFIDSSVTPLDWSADHYNAVGVEPGDGNEFLLRLAFFVGLQVEILDQDLCDAVGLICNLQMDIDRSATFPMPFGTGSYFPIPPAEIEIKQFRAGLFSWKVGLEVLPLLGSKKITANWNASDAGSGSGTITYSEAGAPVALGPINTCAAGQADQVKIELNNFQYHFNQFLIELAAKSVLSIDPIKILLPNGISWPARQPITRFDLSPIFGSVGLKAGAHKQCNWAFNCQDAGPANIVHLSIPVSGQAPSFTTLTASGTEGNNGWYISDVQVSFNTSDPQSNCGSNVKQVEYSFDGSTWTVYEKPFVLGDEGLTTVYYRSTDLDGVIGPVDQQVIQIDKTPPTITGWPMTDPNGYGWYNTDVVFHFEASDATSGIEVVTPDKLLSTEGADQTVTGMAVDMAGLTASYTITGINIDMTPPVVVITSPESRMYENTESFTALWSATDSLAGVATESADLDGTVVTNNQLVELLLFTPGYHTLTVNAADKADNAVSGSAVFVVSVDGDGLLAALEHMCKLGWIDKQGVCNSLSAKLTNAIDSLEKGNMNAAGNQLNAFINEVEAQKDKAINQAAYDVLMADVMYLLENME